MVLACGCNVKGSDAFGCDSNGLCSCKENVIGDKCDYCKDAGSFPVPDCDIGRNTYIWTNSLIPKS